jgi:hypothetical protein
MTGLPPPAPTLLDRLDLTLAHQIVQAADFGEPELLASAQGYHDALFRRNPKDPHFFAALLRQRGFAVWDDDAIEVLAGNNRRLPATSQEHHLLHGLADALQMIRERGSQGRLPDGWFMTEVFRVATRGIARFRNNTIRSDEPWDAILNVSHPQATELSTILDTFHYENRYRDNQALFDSMHPLRQGFRILWRFVRIAPFPDLNGMMGWLAMCSWLLAKGYPLLFPDASDRELVKRMASGPPPNRCVQWEARLLDSLQRRRVSA